MYFIDCLFYFLLAGCNYKAVDFNYEYDTAIIQLADGNVITVPVKSWTDYDGEQLQIEAEDGTIYLTNSFRCDLIKGSLHIED